MASERKNRKGSIFGDRYLFCRMLNFRFIMHRLKNKLTTKQEKIIIIKRNKQSTTTTAVTTTTTTIWYLLDSKLTIYQFLRLHIPPKNQLSQPIYVSINYLSGCRLLIGMQCPQHFYQTSFSRT